MKTKEELNALKEEAETLSKKLHELTEDELAQVVGGTDDKECGAYPIICPKCGGLVLIPDGADKPWEYYCWVCNSEHEW